MNIMASGPITFWQINGETAETVADFIFLVSKITEDGEWAMKLIDTYSLEEKKQRYYFANKGPSSQGYGFSSSHAWMWELDYKESWALKNWYFWTVVLEKTLESPLDCKEIQPVHPKGDQSWVSLEGLMLQLKLQYFGHLMRRADSLEDPDAGKDWGQEEKRTTEDEIVGWHHRPNRHGFGWTLGVGDGQGGLACCGSWGRRVRHDWVTELNWTCS